MRPLRLRKIAFHTSQGARRRGGTDKLSPARLPGGSVWGLTRTSILCAIPYRRRREQEESLQICFHGRSANHQVGALRMR